MLRWTSGRVTSARGNARRLWLGGGAVAMGTGIWSMHYVGMLALRLLVPVVAAGCHSCFGDCPIRGQSQQDEFLSSRGGQHLYGQRHRRYALHRHGRHVSLLFPNRYPLRCSGHCDLPGRSDAYLSHSRRNHFRRLAQNCERCSHGSRRSSDAPHGNGGFQFRAGAICRRQPLALPEYFIRRPDRHHRGHLHAPGDYDFDFTCGPPVFRSFSAQAMELEASKRRSRHVLETSFDAFAGTDSQGKITDWNRQAEIIFGWPHAAALGQTLAEAIIPLRHRESYAQQIRELLASNDEHAQVRDHRVKSRWRKF